MECQRLIVPELQHVPESIRQWKKNEVLLRCQVHCSQMRKGYYRHMEYFFKHLTTPRKGGERNILFNALVLLKDIHIDYCGITRRIERISLLVFGHPINNPSLDHQWLSRVPPDALTTPTYKKQKLPDCAEPRLQVACTTQQTQNTAAASESVVHKLYCIVDAFYDTINSATTRTRTRRSQVDRKAVVTEIAQLRRQLEYMEQYSCANDSQAPQFVRYAVLVNAAGQVSVREDKRTIHRKNPTLISTIAQALIASNTDAARAVHNYIYSSEYDKLQTARLREQQRLCCTTHPALHDYHDEIVKLGQMQSQYTRYEETHICTVDRQFKILDYVKSLEFIE